MLTMAEEKAAHVRHGRRSTLDAALKRDDPA